MDGMASTIRYPARRTHGGAETRARHPKGAGTGRPYSDHGRRPGTMLITRILRNRYSYVLLLPGLAATSLFCYGPLYGLYMAVSDHRFGKPILQAEFVGLKYFREVLVDTSDMLYLLRNTVCMNALSLAACISTALVFAIVLNECRIALVKRVAQIASFFPFFVSWVIVYSIFNAFLAVDTGVVQVALKQLFGLRQGINVMGEPRFAWGVIVLSNLWKSIGYNSVIFLAAIAGIEQEMYEAADIDGATRMMKIRYITLPFLIPTVRVLLIMNTGWLFFSNFDQYYLFTNSMNRPMMEVFDLYIYRFGLKLLNYSYATAVGVLQSIAGVAMLVMVNALSRRISGKGLF
jgi:putative aldouronate transport system permease protein